MTSNLSPLPRKPAALHTVTVAQLYDMGWSRRLSLMS